MTAPADAPEVKSADADRHASRFVLLWSGGGIVFIALLALICWLVLRPVYEVRSALEDCRVAAYSDRVVDEKIVSRLGGSRQAARKLTLYLRTPERWAGEKHRALWLLAGLGPEASGATGVLVKLLATPDKPGQLSGGDNPEAALRDAAARALGWVGPAAARAAPALEAALLDRDYRVRVSAAWALTRVHPEGGLRPLAMLLADPEFDCRQRAAYELGKMGSVAKSVLPVLEQHKAVEDRAKDKLDQYSESWWSIRVLTSAIWKIRSEPDPMPEANREVRAKLNRTLSCEFVQVPFEEALQFTADAGGFKVVISPSPVGNEGLGSVRTVTLRGTLVPYDLALEWICKLCHYDWTVKDGAVYVFDDMELK